MSGVSLEAVVLIVSIVFFIVLGIVLSVSTLVAQAGERDGVVRYTQYGPVDDNGRHRNGYFHRF